MLGLMTMILNFPVILPLEKLSVVIPVFISASIPTAQVALGELR